MLHTKRSAKAKEKLSNAESEMEDEANTKTERGRRLVGDIEATRAVEGPDLDPEDSHRRPLKMDARFRSKSAGADLT